MENNQKKIYVVGSKGHDVNGCFNWDEPFPNLADCDVLIINMQTLDEKTLERIGSGKISNCQKMILNLLTSREHEIYCILNKNITATIDIITSTIFGKKHSSYKFHNYNLFPIEIKLTEEEGDIVNIPHPTKLDSHFKNVRKWFYWIEFNPQLFQDIRFSSNILSVNSYNKPISLEIYSYIIPTSYYNYHEKYSSLYLLPPPTEKTVEDSIDLIINQIRGVKLPEKPPEWIKEFKLPNQENLEKQIFNKKSEIDKLKLELENLTDEKNELTHYRALLYEGDTPLENVVRDAFYLLSFKDIKRGRAWNLEDWIFTTKYGKCVIEVKGSLNRTSLANLTQCNRWVEDYMLNGEKVKGIFIPNQYRKENPKEKIKEKEKFEPNEIDYATTRKICILTSFELHNIVVEFLKGNITKDFIEEKLWKSDGICKII